MSAATRCPWRGCWALVRNTSFRSRPACALSTPWALPAQSWAVQLFQDCPASPPGLRRQSRRQNCATGSRHRWWPARASERSATTRAATSASSTIDAVERLTRLKEGMPESRVLLLPDAFERFKAICTVIQELYIYCTALVQQFWAPMLEQADAAHAADSKKAHTDIHQAPNVSHTGEVATADDSSVVQCGEGPCDAGGSAASARSDAGEVVRSTAADLHPRKNGIVLMSGNRCLYSTGRSVCGLWRVIERPGSATRGFHSGRAAPLAWHGNGRPLWVESERHNRSAELLYHLAACDIDGAHKRRRGPWSDCTTGPWS